MESRLDAWKQRARHVQNEVCALYLACRDPRMPWYARVLAGAVVAYALSPVDLIPDFVPILGYLDDLVLVPLGVALVLRLVPADLMAACRLRASEAVGSRSRASLVAAALVIGIWLLLAAQALALVARLF